MRSGLAAEAMQTKKPCSGNTDAVDARFVTHFGAPQDDQIRFLPLLLKDKVAALLYADSGNGNATTKMDGAALELLVTATGAWLEVISLRKQASKETAQEDRPEATTSSQSSQPHSTQSHSASHAPAQAPAPSFSDPFAAHSPVHTTAVPPPAAKVALAETALAVAAIAEVSSSSASGAAVAPAVDAFAGLSAEDAETHRKAQRFARLLIDEIKLYNQGKVTEGRKNKNLYDHLREDIEKSRATYQKRFSQSAAGSADYFNHEVVHILAEGDVRLMGANFPASS
ncbi:MAG: hypothetical protein JOY93_05420 [Acidobacteriales bacterium]|nr:hypothetical protein [Terriglobales bacterium]